MLVAPTNDGGRTTPYTGTGNGPTKNAFISFEIAITVRQLDLSDSHEKALAILAPVKNSLKAKHAEKFFLDVQRTNPSKQETCSSIPYNT